MKKKLLIILGVAVIGVAGVSGAQDAPDVNQSATVTPQVSVVPETPVVPETGGEEQLPVESEPTPPAEEGAGQQEGSGEELPPEGEPEPEPEPEPVVITSYSSRNEGTEAEGKAYCDVTYSDGTTSSRNWKSWHAVGGRRVEAYGVPCDDRLIGQLKP